MSNNILLFLFGILFVFTLIIFYLQESFIKELKVKYPDIWNELGKPTLLTSNTIKQGMLFTKFLFSKSCSQLDDKEKGDGGIKN